MKCLCLCLKSLESNCWLTALAELKDLTVASFKLLQHRSSVLRKILPMVLLSIIAKKKNALAY